MSPLTDAEHAEYFLSLGNARAPYAGAMTRTGVIHEPTHVLDLASGHGHLTLGVAAAFPRVAVVATGLTADRRTFVDLAAAPD